MSRACDFGRMSLIYASYVMVNAFSPKLVSRSMVAMNCSGINTSFWCHSNYNIARLVLAPSVMILVSIEWISVGERGKQPTRVHIRLDLDIWIAGHRQIAHVAGKNLLVSSGQATRSCVLMLAAMNGIGCKLGSTRNDGETRNPSYSRGTGAGLY